MPAASMTICDLPLAGLRLIELTVHRDQRGHFLERYNEAVFAAGGLPTAFVQDNHSRSEPGVLRGLHYQVAPRQGKLVGVVRGAILDVAVDIRPESPTYGRHVAVELREEQPQLLWIPAGFAHGFCVIGESPADVLYKVDSAYEPASEGGIHWADPELGIPWPTRHPIVSARDQKLPTFAEYRSRTVQWCE
ncbi:MAG TPA: dTDP-4-dehydrorhamnose 3,5-epimerase [Rhodothermales bacterium]